MHLPCTSLMLFQVLALHTLVLCCQASTFTDQTDKQALLEFQSNLSPNSRVLLASWNESFDLCNWTGVTCARKHKRVTSLNLSGMRLTGVISPSIGNLSFLTTLSLALNAFHGSIPPEVGKLFRLRHLNLSNNVLGGGIPRGLSNCSSLLTNDLSSNNLEHDIPPELASLSSLVFLSVRGNALTGTFPASFGNLTSLERLDLSFNRMEGEIPDSMSRLTRLTFLRLALNKFSGVFPPAIYNLSSLLFLSIPSNSFSGQLRPDVDLLFPNIQVLFLGGNRFEGQIPSSLANITSLRELDIASCKMTGSIPLSFGRLHNLEILGLNYNSLGSYSPRDLDFLGSLTNCTQLQYLGLGHNRLGGTLPHAISNLSSQLTYLFLGRNLISGTIPLDIGNLVNLQTFKVEENLLTGELPTSLGMLTRLEKLMLQSNMMSGEIPSSLGNLSMIAELYLYNNTFEGTIPSSLGNCGYLLKLGLDFNTLHGSIPQELMEARSLLVLNVSYNDLTGNFPSEVGELENLIQLDASHNRLSGRIPQTLGSCLSLEEITLNRNLFEGSIIDIRGLRDLEFLDLSNNNLSGSIPGYLVNLSSLQYVNLSVNSLEGPVPTEGAFGNFSQVFIFGNMNLCGGISELQLKPCPVQGEVKRERSSMKKKIAIGIGASVVTLFVMGIIISLCWFKKRNKNDRVSNMYSSTTVPVHERVSYEELHNATGGFSGENTIGSGNFGVVYKALLGPENRAVAIKVLNLSKPGAAKSFSAECEALKGVRHRNLVKLVTACSSIDYKGNEFRALVYDFMPNGSLDTWLHREGTGDTTASTSRALTLRERFSIAIDVASALEYLHVNCHDLIAHCDLKPSNVLLDDDLTAHVSDFGLARLLLKFDQEAFLNQLSSAGVRGTVGYAAPEYGMGGQPSIHGDVYSFGILLLEMFTGKRPTDELFEGNFTLYSYIKSALPERVLETVDKLILQRGLMRVGFPVAECLTMVLELGLRCCEELPRNRLAMTEVVKELFTMRERFFKTRRIARR
ncbi:putative receptor-like protein kinase At3g47110 [Raphanus sativus]|uniref:non-specific serine/threonine protein kinase n=1 Tax=Raphanus sativus TaxID=3726 RepID=A0A6J0JKJ6_RAPSA|nr:putative receptor-like protein kinase At3g47110 [Raphanus sativus]